MNQINLETIDKYYKYYKDTLVMERFIQQDIKNTRFSEEELRKNKYALGLRKLEEEDCEVMSDPNVQGIENGINIIADFLSEKCLVKPNKTLLKGEILKLFANYEFSLTPYHLSYQIDESDIKEMNAIIKYLKLISNQYSPIIAVMRASNKRTILSKEEYRKTLTRIKENIEDILNNKIFEEKKYIARNGHPLLEFEIIDLIEKQCASILEEIDKYLNKINTTSSSMRKDNFNILNGKIKWLNYLIVRIDAQKFNDDFYTILSQDATSIINNILELTLYTAMSDNDIISMPDFNDIFNLKFRQKEFKKDITSEYLEKMIEELNYLLVFYNIAKKTNIRIDYSKLSESDIQDLNSIIRLYFKNNKALEYLSDKE